MEENKSPLTLYPGVDFTSAKLIEFLNKKYTHKKTGQPFTTGDIQQYLKRKHLPKPYGGHPINIVECPEIGVKVIRVFFDL